MVNIFEELKMPNLFWDWNQNFSLNSTGENEMSECMKEAWIPESIFQDIPVDRENDIFLYPNPGADYLFVDVNNIADELSISIFDARGAKIYEKFLASRRMIIPILEFPTGIYFIECVSSEGHRYIDKFFVE